MTLSLDDRFAVAVVKASDHRSGSSGLVALAIGKKQRALLDIVDGRVATAEPVTPDEAEAAAAVTVPVTAAQLAAIVAGEESLAQAFMRGDVKPAGATGPLLAAVELFEDPEFRSRLGALLADPGR